MGPFLIEIFQVKPEQGKKEINSQLDKLSGITKDQARRDFLNILIKQETFGSAFIDCRQTADKGLPPRIIVAINKKGVSIVHPESKKVTFF